MTISSKNPWWRGAVIYQIYPRSFMDANNDGTGDLRGIIDRFDYVVSLGVDAIWISPFFKSPMRDFGYDVSDYRAIDPLFGSMDDFDELIEIAHKNNIKVMIDQVLSHSSDEHAWFTESRADQTNAKADWYVWADAKEDGTPPNNWLSVFGGSAWQWDPRRSQYYLHNFLPSQPDLNFHNPEVRQASLDNLEFWLKKGVDGFRLDAIIFCFHDQQLRNNPAKKVYIKSTQGSQAESPYSKQEYKYSHTQKENLGLMEDIRSLLNRYPGTVALGEIGTDDSISLMAEYTKGDNRLHMAYSFDLLTDEFSVAHIREVVNTAEKKMIDGWPCYALSNHDVQRIASRWTDNNASNEASRAFNLLLGTLRGSLCVFQGEELGLPEAIIEFDNLQDPFGKNFWPIFKGRDGCRTPMPWENNCKNAGFSKVSPWLPVSIEHLPLSVANQENDKNSVLNQYRKFLQWRKQHPVLLGGDFEFINTQEPIIAYKRFNEETELHIFINLSATEQIHKLTDASHYHPLNEFGAELAELDNNTINFGAYSVFIALIK